MALAVIATSGAASVGLAEGRAATVPDTSVPTDGESEELTELRIAMSLIQSIPYMTLVQVAADHGWFEEEGLDVTIIEAGGGGDTTRLVTSGAADIAIAGPEAIYLASQAPGTNMQIMGPWFQVNIVKWVGTVPDATLEDLQGARLGVTGAGSTGEFIATAMTAERPDLDLEIVIVGGLGDNLTAMKADEIDGAYSAEPITTQQMATEDVHVLVAARDIIGDIPMNLVAANGDYAAENRSAVEAFWRVADRAFSYMREDTEAAIADVNEYINMDPALITTAIQETPRFDEAWSIAVDCEAMTNLADRMLEGGVVDEPVDWSASLDQSFLPEDARCDDL